MYRRHGNKLGLVFWSLDLTVTSTVWVGAYVLRFALFPSPQGIPHFARVLGALPLVLILATVAYRLCGLYEIHRLVQLPRELGVVLKASLLLFVLVITVTFYRRDLYESRLALSFFLVLNSLGLAVTRRLLWQAIQYFRSRGLNYGRALIVGSGRMGKQVVELLQKNKWTGLEVLGFVEHVNQKRDLPMLPKLGTLDELEHLVSTYQIDHVFIALPLSRYGELPEVYSALSKILVEVQLVPDIPGLTGMKLRTLDIDNVAFLGLRENPHCGWHRIAKRAMDIAVGSLALLLLAPLMTLLAVAIKLTSSGPVLFRQARAGQGGKPFQMLKFRTMQLDAETQTGPVWAKRNDKRCTPLGQFLRHWSLDELPQLLNVLAGDMSLVGPRPERGVFVEKFRQELPTYTQRYQVKAGMTGWAQVNGWRGNTSLRHRLRCDLYYISHWSIGLDFWILLMTPWYGFRHRNAY